MLCLLLLLTSGGWLQDFSVMTHAFRERLDQSQLPGSVSNKVLQESLGEKPVDLSVCAFDAGGQVQNSMPQDRALRGSC